MAKNSRFQTEDICEFPGGELVAKGLSDLRRGISSEEAILVSIAAPRLTWLGFDVPELKDVPLPYEHALYEAMELRLGKGAYSSYNALISRVVSFANAVDAKSAK